jgi:hypothetical protein
MNQPPTEESLHKKNQIRSVYLYNQKGGLDKSSPYIKKIKPSQNTKAKNPTHTIKWGLAPFY